MKHLSLLACSLAATTVLALPAAIACSERPELARFASDRYGDRIEFDVLRNGKPVGEHVTTFEHTPDGLSVRSRMQLGVSILFIPVYAFEYESSEIWCDGELHGLFASVSDDGERRTLEVSRDGAVFVIDGPGGNLRHAADLMPTNHWNPAVLGSAEVINTLTGRINAVDIVPCAANPPGGAGSGVPASCFDYTGELVARVWYDRDMRWVGLEFEGRDGSNIVLACRDCGRGR